MPVPLEMKAFLRFPSCVFFCFWRAARACEALPVLSSHRKAFVCLQSISMPHAPPAHFATSVPSFSVSPSPCTSPQVEFMEYSVQSSTAVMPRGQVVLRPTAETSHPGTASPGLVLSPHMQIPECWAVAGWLIQLDHGKSWRLSFSRDPSCLGLHLHIHPLSCQSSAFPLLGALYLYKELVCGARFEWMGWRICELAEQEQAIEE